MAMEPEINEPSAVGPVDERTKRGFDCETGKPEMKLADNQAQRKD